MGRITLEFRVNILRNPCSRGSDNIRIRMCNFDENQLFNLPKTSVLKRRQDKADRYIQQVMSFRIEILSTLPRFCFNGSPLAPLAPTVFFMGDFYCQRRVRVSYFFSTINQISAYHHIQCIVSLPNVRFPTLKPLFIRLNFVWM